MSAPRFISRMLVLILAPSLLVGCGLFDFNPAPVPDNGIGKTVRDTANKHPLPPAPKEYESFGNWLLFLVIAGVLVLGLSVFMKSVPLGTGAATIIGVSLFLRTTLWFMQYVGPALLVGLLIWGVAKLWQRYELGVKLTGNVQKIPPCIVENAHAVKGLLDDMQASSGAMSKEDQASLTKAQSIAASQAANVAVLAKIVPTPTKAA